MKYLKSKIFFNNLKIRFKNSENLNKKNSGTSLIHSAGKLVSSSLLKLGAIAITLTATTMIFTTKNTASASYPLHSSISFSTFEDDDVIDTEEKINQLKNQLILGNYKEEKIDCVIVTPILSDNMITGNENFELNIILKNGDSYTFTVKQSVKIFLKDLESITFNLSLNIPNGTKTIGNASFIGCKCVKEVNIPEGVEVIGEWAFGACKNLGGITIPGSVKTIKQEAFAYCKQLEYLNIKSGVKSIGKEAFWGCKCLTGIITIPKSIMCIGSDCFSGCDGLKEIVIPERSMKILVNVPFESEVN